MNELLSRSWWALALRGVAAIVFGALALMWPDLTLFVLIALFAAYALIGGIVSVVGALKNRKSDEDWWMLFLLGLVGIGAGVIAVVHPALSLLLLVLVIAAYALITGILDIAIAIRLRKVLRNEWLLVLSGITAIVFGVLAFLFPDAGALAVVWLISLYALITGALLLALAFSIRAKVKPGTTERRVTPDRRATVVHP